MYKIKLIKYLTIWIIKISKTIIIYLKTTNLLNIIIWYEEVEDYLNKKDPRFTTTTTINLINYDYYLDSNSDY